MDEKDSEKQENKVSSTQEHYHEHAPKHNHSHSHPKKKIGFKGVFIALGAIVLLVLVVFAVNMNSKQKDTSNQETTNIQTDKVPGDITVKPTETVKPSCIDSDKEDYTTKGYVSLNDKTMWDICTDTSLLIEQLCSGDIATSTTINCKGLGLECSDGKCIKVSTQTSPAQIPLESAPETTATPETSTPIENTQTSTESVIKGPIIKNLKVRPIGYIEKGYEENGTIFETYTDKVNITFDVVGLEPITCKANMNTKIPTTTVINRWWIEGKAVKSSLSSLNKANVKCTSKYGASPVVSYPIKLMT